MKKDGITLKLIIIIAILSMLILIVTGVYNLIKKKYLHEEYENLVTYVENKAEQYAKDITAFNPIHINVEYLLDRDYINTQDDILHDPRNNTSMNCYMIDVTYENNTYQAKLQQRLENADGTCNTSKIDTGQFDLLCNGKKCSNNIYNDDVTLSIGGMSQEYLKNSIVTWHSSLGSYNYQDIGSDKSITLSPENTLNAIYNIVIENNNKLYTINENIRIDKTNKEAL